MSHKNRIVRNCAMSIESCCKYHGSLLFKTITSNSLAYATLSHFAAWVGNLTAQKVEESSCLFFTHRRYFHLFAKQWGREILNFRISLT